MLQPEHHRPIGPGRTPPRASAARAPVPPRRRVDAAEFAFLRAVIQGVPAEEAARRYLGPGLRRGGIERELRRLRTELLAAARRAHAFGDIRLLRLQLEQLPVTVRERAAPAGPSLEAYRAEVDPSGDFYTEAELLAMYQAQHAPSEAGAARRAQRLTRLRQRQRAALDTLEQVVVQPPRRTDPPTAWLEPRAAAAIEAAGLRGLGELCDRIVERGYRWWKTVPGVGECAAVRVVEWIARNAESLGVQLDETARKPRRELVAAWREAPAVSRIAPLERLLVPRALDGAQARAGLTDRQVIEAWLAERAGPVQGNTWRLYRREAERVLLWAVVARGKSLASLDSADAAAYAGFLLEPAPASLWVSARCESRLSPRWRPFLGPLSPKSAAHAIAVTRVFFQWMATRGFIALNPFDTGIARGRRQPATRAPVAQRKMDQVTEMARA